MRSIGRHILCLVVTLVVLPVALVAQGPPTYDVAFWLAATVDPNATAPVATPVNYAGASITCSLAKITRTTSLVVNPSALRFNDPANPATFDCAITITAQVAALPNDQVQYRASARQVVGATAGPYGALSTNPFARNPPPAALAGLGVF